MTTSHQAAKAQRKGTRQIANAVDPVAPRPPGGEEFITPERMVMSIRMRFNAIRRLTPELLATQLDQLQRGYLSPIMRSWEAIERRDYRLSAVAPKAKSALARHGFEILTHDDSAAALEHKAALEYFYNNLTVTDAYDENRVGSFSMLVRNMADAIGFKYSTHEILWKPSYSGLTAEFRKAPAWFFENITGRLRFLPEDYNYYGVPMEPDRWLTHVDDGIDEAASVAYMFKTLPLRDWLNFSEKFGIPGVLGRTQASIGTPQWNAMVEAVGKFANDFAAVCNIGDAIELIKAEGGTSTLPFQPIVEAMDRALSILWRGADLGTEAHRGGGEGQGASLQQSETDELDADRATRIQETLNIHLDRRVIAWTFGSAITPLAFIRVKTKPNRNITADLDTITKLAPMGVPFEINNVLERLGWERPKEGAELLTVPAPVAPTAPNPGEQITENERRAVNKFLARSRELWGESLADDLRPLRDALAKVLHGDAEGLMARAATLYNTLPALGSAIIGAKKSSAQLETILGTALAVGLAGTPGETPTFANGNSNHGYHGQFASGGGEIREFKVSTTPALRQVLGIESDHVYADAAALAKKHPEYFKNSQEVKAYVDFVFARPTHVMPGNEADHRLVVRAGETDDHKSIALEIEKKGGKYRVKSAHTLDDRQLAAKEGKFADQVVKLGVSRVNPHDRETPSRRLSAPHDAPSAIAKPKPGAGGIQSK